MLSLLALWLLAQSSALPEWASPLLNAGVLGALTLLWVLDKIGNQSERNRLREENAELRRELREQNEIFRKEVTPPLIELARLLPQILDALVRRGRS